MSADRPVSPAPDTVTDEMVRVAAEAIEDVAIARIGRDLGTLHRNEIVRAGLEAVVPLIRAHLAAGSVAVDPADLRTVLDARCWHSHSRPGVWDDDNPPERAGKPCVECAARERLRASLTATQEEER